MKKEETPDFRVDETSGWVVISLLHPTTKRDHMVPSTFRKTRSLAIAAFVEGSGQSWSYWKKKFNFRCLRAKSVITLEIQYEQP